MIYKLPANSYRHELVDRLAHDAKLSNITVVGLDPGVMGTDLTRRGSAVMYYGLKFVAPLVAPLLVKFSPNGDYRPAWKSAGDAIQLAFETEASAGKPLYLNGTDELETSKEAQDDAKRKALWTYGLEAAQIKQGDTILQDWQ